MPDPLQPPVPFDDFTFSFDPALHNLFPSPPPLPSSADLFSPSETTNLFGFLDNLNWDLEAEAQNVTNTPSPLTHLQQDAGHPASHFPALVRSTSQEGGQSLHDLVSATQREAATTLVSLPAADSSSPVTPQTPAQLAASPTSTSPSGNPSSAPPKPKPLLSTPQKRLNHIMSEQKRRNAIRDGYVQLTALLAPAGAPPGAGMPTRGRPKGSGSRNGGRGNKAGMAFKGKSGILFRAVEYIRWLEEGKDALLEEVTKVEAAAGISHAA